MTIALYQEDTPAQSGTSGTTYTSNAYSGNTALGSILEVWLAYATGGGTVSSVVDSASQSYTLIGRTTDSTDNSILECWAFTNNQSTAALTATATWSSSTSFQNIHQREIRGGANQSPNTYNFPARIVTPGSGTNAILISLTSTSNPALISGVVAAVAGSAALAAGTGFTGTTHFATGGGFAGSLFESQRVITTGSNNCTWTDSTNGGASTYLGGAIIWLESVVTSYPLMGQICL